ncbi:hypothetical protein [Dickeya fangzhongdai]|uniref:hypothetical protein n=1 Tax=Dickeya fangzhongdai TaxID=1778540 RepID=UPI0026E00025|nr:hypothetical protein [Dickeya fangzhongdai]WKV52304.1 hypothetical protein PL145_08850 [Dickeya fangzhongdai]
MYAVNEQVARLVLGDTIISRNRTKHIAEKPFYLQAIGFYGVKNCAEVSDFAGCAAGKPRKPVPRLERVTGGPNSEVERRRYRAAAQFSHQPVVKERWR